MFDLLDLILLRRGIPKDDRTLAFRRIDGDSRSSVLYFLPWGTPFALARRVGLMPLPFLAAYEMPPAIVSSEPELSVRSVVALVADARELLKQREVSPSSALIVGLSVGTFPAMHLANRIGARVCFVAGADRGDLMLWQSPATRIVKRRAMQKGFDLSHFTRVMQGYHTVDNLSGLAARSVFVIGDRDPFVPLARKNGLLAGIERQGLGLNVVRIDAGHVRTMMASTCYQRDMLGVSPAPRTWVSLALSAQRRSTSRGSMASAQDASPQLWKPEPPES